jgi:glycosyltransferase involved in cell wall biosynthesis
MRILFLSTWFPYPPDNGSRIRAYHLLRALGDSNQVTLVAFRPVDRGDNGQCLSPELNLRDVHPVPVDPFRYVNIPQVLKFSSPIPLTGWPSKLMRQTVAKVVDSGKWDAVVAFQSPAARYALQLPGVTRILDVDTAYSYQAHEYTVCEDHPIARLRTWVSWQKTYRYEARLFRRFQACTVVSSKELDYLKAMTSASNSRVEVVPNGVDCQHNHPGLAQPQPNTLIYNGALTYSANRDAMRYFLGKVYPLIKQQVPDVSLTITGSTSGVDLSGLAIDESVRLSGYVVDIRIPVSQASVCIAPIRQGGGTRLKILEAMALGTPVVTTSKGAEGLDVTSDQHLLIADKPAEFASQVIRLLRNETLCQRLTINARRLVERCYDWPQVGDRFVDLVEDVVSRNAPGGPPSR